MDESTQAPATLTLAFLQRQREVDHVAEGNTRRSTAARFGDLPSFSLSLFLFQRIQQLDIDDVARLLVRSLNDALMLADQVPSGRASRQYGERAVFPYPVAIDTMPKVAFAPLFIAWLGFDIASKVALAAFIAIFPVVVATAAGLYAASENERMLFVQREGFAPG